MHIQYAAIGNQNHKEGTVTTMEQAQSQKWKSEGRHQERHEQHKQTNKSMYATRIKQQ
jgi:hypothetical protein